MKDKYYIIAGDYINAISVWRSLKSLNVVGSIYFLSTSGRNMVGRIFPKSKVIHGIKNPDSLFDFLKSLKKDTVKFLFLTDELFQIALWENKNELEELNVVVRMGKLHPKTITNKSSFLKEIRDKTYVPVPVSYSMSEAKRVNKPVFVKFNTTVIDDNLVPKGKDIYNNKELENYLKYLTEKGFDLKNVEIQELLSTDCKDNISICGWYEKGFHSFHQTRKVLQHPPKRGAGDVIEYMDLNENLADYAMQILVLFDYCGPFEIEFIKEKEEEKYKVLEMNPRFWMQHALVEQISGHLLVARYIGISPVKPVLKYKYWMYPVISLLKIAVGNFNYMPFFFKKDVIKPISVGQAIRFLLLYLLQL